MLTYAIGDLHGRYDLMLRAKDIIEADRPGEPRRIVVMGDFVDRGPQSAELIAALRLWHSKQSIEFVVLQGNHEDMMIACCLGLAQLSWWVGNGGGRTLESYGYVEGDFLQPFKGNLEDDLKWLASLPKYLETEKQVFVHAGVSPGKPMAEQSKDMLQWHCWDRNFEWPWEDEAGGVHQEADYPKHVVHGHEQWAKGPILLESRTDLDTFAWYTGRLAIGVFDDSQGKPIDILWAEGEPHGGS